MDTSTRQLVTSIIDSLRKLFAEYSGKATRFAIMGFLNLVGTYAIYAALVSAGCRYNIALLFDYAIGTVLGYVLHRRWTFASRERAHRSFPRYVAICVAAYLLNGLLLNVIVLSDLSGPLLGQVFALAVTTMLSFLLQLLWVFRKEKVAVAGGGVKIC